MKYRLMANLRGTAVAFVEADSEDAARALAKTADWETIETDADITPDDVFEIEEEE